MFFIAGVYMWVENPPTYTVTNAYFFQLVENDINTYQQLGRVYLTCDWNARVGKKLDFIIHNRNINGIGDYAFEPEIQWILRLTPRDNN